MLLPRLPNGHCSLGLRSRHAREGEQCGKSRAVVRNAGAMEAAIGSNGNIFRLTRRKHGIEMCGEGDVGALAILERMGDDVAAAVHAGDHAERSELREHPLRARLFEEGRGGDTADLQMLFVDGLLLAIEPLERVANGGRVGEVGEEAGKRLGEYRREFAGGGQMSV